MTDAQDPRIWRWVTNADRHDYQMTTGQCAEGRVPILGFVLVISWKNKSWMLSVLKPHCTSRFLFCCRKFVFATVDSVWPSTAPLFVANVQRERTKRKEGGGERRIHCRCTAGCPLHPDNWSSTLKSNFEYLPQNACMFNAFVPNLRWRPDPRFGYIFQTSSKRRCYGRWFWGEGNSTWAGMNWSLLRRWSLPNGWASVIYVLFWTLFCVRESKDNFLG